MIVTLLAMACLSCLIWAGLLLFRGGFWRADQRLAEVAPPADWPEIVAVIPARDEADTIADVVAAHRASTYPGAFRVIVVDDQSSDGTADLARSPGGSHSVDVIAAPPLPDGWSGKMNAVAAGLAHARDLAPDARYILLTDADIVHAPQTLRLLVAFAEDRGLSMVSLMSRLDARGLWGRLLIPAFVFFFQKLYPFGLVNRPDHPMAAAAGGCVLVRRDTLDDAGGIGAIKGALIDDCALAHLIKHHDGGQPIWLGLADGEAVSLRDNRSLHSIWTMVARTAFTQLDHSVLKLVGTVLGMVLIYLAAPVSFCIGVAQAEPTLAAIGLIGWLAMAAAYWPTLRLYRQPPPLCLLLPVAASFYTAMTIGSAISHWRGHGGRWKGRTYP